MPRKPLIIGNWKMNLNLEEARRLILDIRLAVANIKNVDIVVCPSFLHLKMVRFQLPSNISLGAQNCFWEKSGQFTGEVSPYQLKDISCKFVILGHSERRRHLKEGDVMIASKLEAALLAGLIPILCVGETKEERERNFTESKIEEQAKVALEDMSREQVKRVVIAYEPIWAIGTGNPCHSSDAETVASFIRKILEEKYGRETSEAVRILYGGSVDALNIFTFVEKPNIDGALVGGASLKADEFINIIKNTTKIYKLNK